MVDPDYLVSPNDPSIPRDYNREKDAAIVELYRRYAEAAQKHGTHAIVQICHAGRQSSQGAGERGLFTPSIAPSPIQLNIGDSILAKIIQYLLFPTPREMTQKDIETVTRHFVDCARLMADAGFAGVELHGAHGYLIGKLFHRSLELSSFVMNIY
jgi:2,4-dienoyl-CoA reductase-like NADH-dependent reductase (Old Yellow Enzyme family)